MKKRGLLFTAVAVFCFVTASLAQVNPCLECNINCYEPYFVNLNISDSCQFANNAERFRKNLSSVLYNKRNPLWTINQNAEWVMYYHIENWQGPVTDIAINNLTKKYESLANQWLDGLTDFDAAAPDSVTIKVFGFVFNAGVLVDSSFYRTYGKYPIVTNWKETNENAPWQVVYRSDSTKFNQNWYQIDNFDTLKVLGNNVAAYPNAKFSPADWGSYVHPEGVDMFYTKFWHKTSWDAVAQRQYLKIGGCITNYATGKTLDDVFAHEMGHCLFHDDLYDNVKYPCAPGLPSVMNSGSVFQNGTWVTDFDKVIMRIVWEAQKYRKNLAIDMDNDGFCAKTDCDDNNSAIGELTVKSTAIDVACFGNFTGEINLSVSGGTSGYSYVWNDGSTAQNRQDLAAGTYFATITDQKLCKTIVSKTVAQPIAPLQVTSAGTDIACFGKLTGQINLAVLGGTAGYSFLWNDGNTEKNRQNLAAGNYSAIITDEKGCTVSTSYSVTEPPQIIATFTATDATCGQGNGAIVLAVQGGTSPYQFNWSNGVSTQNLNNLFGGTYTVVVKDANGCTIEKTAGLSNQNGPSAIAAVNAATCFGAANGAAILTISSGTMPFTFKWSDGSTAQNRVGLAAGIYTVNILDANNCSTAVTIEIVQPGELTLTTKATPAVCGQPNGSASVEILGGTGPYAVLWNNGATTSTLSNLSSGNYTATISDVNGCTRETSVNITSAEAPTASTEHIAVNCFGEATGVINLNLVDGTAPFSFKWSNGATTQNLVGLTANEYSCTITDANSCTTVVSQTISQPTSPLSVSATTVNVGCFGEATGAINLAVAGGTANYSFSWNNGSQAQNLVQLPAGNYAVIVTDAKGCTKQMEQILTQPNAALSVSATTTNVPCFGEASGTISLKAVGGTPNYFYLWNDGSTAQTRSNLAAGNYSVIITDANGCSSTISQVVTQPALPLSTSIVTTNATDNNKDGMATATGNGGTPPYSFVWSNGATGNQINSLSSGTYFVTNTDANNCEKRDTITIKMVTGANDHLAQIGLKIYPNPTSDLLVVQSQNFLQNDLKVQLSNASGQIVMEKDFYQGSTLCNLQTETLCDGTYFLTVRNDTLVKVFKVVIVR